jgi:hypothetical protein
VILPFTILRRLECVLESSKPKVLEQVEDLKAMKKLEENAREKFLPERGDNVPFAAWLSYWYLPAVLKTLLEMTIRHTVGSRSSWPIWPRIRPARNGSQGEDPRQAPPGPGRRTTAL